MFNNSRKTSLILLAALVVSGLSFTAAYATPAAEFQPILAVLQEKTQVPIILPSQLPQSNYTILPNQIKPGESVDDSPPKFHPHLLEATPSRYVISLDVAPQCQGSGACDRGLIMGEKMTANTPQIPRDFTELTVLYQNPEGQDYSPIKSPQPPTRVQLSGGITGYFVGYTCGANCGNSKVYWDQNGYRYQVGLEMGSQQAVVNLANSAIENYE